MSPGDTDLSPRITGPVEQVRRSADSKRRAKTYSGAFKRSDAIWGALERRNPHLIDGAAREKLEPLYL